jgi:hypothetical protein
MRASVELSRDCHKAWWREFVTSIDKPRIVAYRYMGARLAYFLKCNGVLSCEEMGIGNPPNFRSGS